jgi:glucose-fructose oxidoreductase
MNPLFATSRNNSLALSRRDFIARLSLGAAGTLLVAKSRAQSPVAERKLGVALVGLGNYSTGQLGPALQQTKNCQLVGVVTGSPQKGAKWAKDYGFPEKSVYHYDTMARMADNPDIDIVYVVTPNGLHAGHAIAAAQAGKHVICEKPMANTVAECDAILAACRAAKRKLSVGYRLHFDPYHLTMVKMAGDAAIGPFTKMSGNRGFFLQPGAWRGDKKLAGGGPIMDLGIYIIHGACMAAGGAPPIAVTAHEEPKTKPKQFPDVEEKIRWTMEFADGAVGDGVTGYAHNSDTFRAESPRGWIEFKEHAFTYRGMVVATNRGPLTFDPPVNQQALQMDDFAQCVREDRESRVPGEMGRRDLAIIEAIYTAAHTGKRTVVKV